MKLAQKKSLPGHANRLLPLVPVAWMLLVLMIFVAIRVIGSHSFQSLHLVGKPL